MRRHKCALHLLLTFLFASTFFFFSCEQGIEKSLAQYTVTFIDSEKNFRTEVQITEGETVAPSAISKHSESPYSTDGYRYEFAGWKYESGNPFSFSTPITQDTTVYANWTKTYMSGSGESSNSTYTVTLCTSDGDRLHQLDIEANGYIPVNIHLQFSDDSFLEGFAGWYDENGERFDLSTPITHNITLYAKRYEGGEQGGGKEDDEEPYPGTKYTVDKTATRIEVPEGVTKIESMAFRECKNLAEVVLPSSLTSIESGAFYECESLVSVVIPEDANIKGSFSFQYCPNLKSITVPKNASDVNIYFCDNLEELIIPDDENIAGSLSINSCPKLSSITIPRNASNVAISFCENADIIIPDNAHITGNFFLSEAPKVESLSIPEGVTYIHIYECPNIKEITLPTTLTAITVSGCFEELEIPEKVESIEYIRSPNLRKITIPKSVLNIGSWWFQCDPEEVYFTGDINDWLNIKFDNGSNSLFYSCYRDKTKLYLNGIPAEEIEEIVIPNGLERVPDYAFYGWKNIKSILIPDSVTSIEDEAFDSTRIQKITIPKNIKSLGQSAFHTINYDEVHFKGDLAGWLTLVKEMNLSAMFSSYKELYLDGSLATDIVIPDGFSYIPDCAFLGCTSITSVTIPSSVKSIGMGAFCLCNNLKSASLPEGLETIERSAFDECASLEEIVIPDSVTGNINAFRECKSLKSIVIGDGVTSIGDNFYSFVSGFYDDTSLVSVKLGKNVKSIGVETFYKCSSLKEINIPDCCESIGDTAFAGCTALEEITLPKSLKTISGGLFHSCANLKKFVIQEGVTKIEKLAFHFGGYLRPGVPLLLDGSDVSKMRDLIIPASVEYIEEGAFSVWTGTPTGYTETFTITFLGTEPPFLEKGYIGLFYPPSAIYVPNEALDTYKT